MEKSGNSSYLGTEKISKLMLSFSVPSVLSLLVSALYNIVDQIFIGNSELSTLGNAATGVVFPFFIIAQAFAWCYGGGCASFLGICLGRRDEEKIHKAIGTGVTVTLIISVVLIGGFWIFQTPLLYIFGASENTIDMATEYLRIVLLFFPAFLLSNMLSSVIRSDGSPKTSMFVVLSGAIANIILDPVFIFGFKWGMTGAALATGIGQLISLVICIVYFLKPKTFKFTLRSFIPDFNSLKNITRLGFSSFITQITTLIVTIVSNVMLSKYGALSHYGADVPIAVIGIATKVFTIVGFFVVGINLGCQPIVSYNIGAKKYDRVKKLYKLTILCTVIIGVCATLMFQLFPDFIISLFGVPTNIPNPEDYWLFSQKTFRIYLMLVTFTCIVKMNAIFFQSAGKPVFAIVTALIRDIVCFVPFIIILPRFFGVEGVLYAAPLADFVSMIVAVILMISFIKGLNRKSLENNN